jgi:hypothetical protein
LYSQMALEQSLPIVSLQSLHLQCLRLLSTLFLPIISHNKFFSLHPIPLICVWLLKSHWLPYLMMCPSNKSRILVLLLNMILTLAPWSSAFFNLSQLQAQTNILEIALEFL